eukprot:14592100-Alexandrium_andersonii.AAC.1
MLFASRGVFWILEQPLNSILEAHPRFVWLLRTMPIYRHFARMKDYGHDSEKGTWLYSGHAFIADIAKYRAPNVAASTSVNSYNFVNARGK